MDKPLQQQTTAPKPGATPPRDDQFAPKSPVAQGSPTPDQPKKLPLVGIIAVIGILVTLVLGGIMAQNVYLLSPKPVVIPTRQLTPPTPTPERKLSLIATQSAFIQLQANVASLSGSIQNVIVSDPSLFPPVLDLPLGFSN